MDLFTREMVWQQFSAAMRMLENAIRACPEELWGREPVHESQFWYNAYHTLFFLDLYLSDSVDGFLPPPPFTLEELDPAGVLPPRVYTKTELLAYLEHGRRKGRSVLENLTEEAARRPAGFAWVHLSAAELHLQSVRHVQHHTAQLNLLLRQAGITPPRWVSSAG